MHRTTLALQSTTLSLMDATCVSTGIPYWHISFPSRDFHSNIATFMIFHPCIPCVTIRSSSYIYSGNWLTQINVIAGVILQCRQPVGPQHNTWKRLLHATYDVIRHEHGTTEWTDECVGWTVTGLNNIYWSSIDESSIPPPTPQANRWAGLTLYLAQLFCKGGGGRQEQLSIMQGMLAWSRQLSAHIVDQHHASHCSHDALTLSGTPILYGHFPHPIAKL